MKLDTERVIIQIEYYRKVIANEICKFFSGTKLEERTQIQKVIKECQKAIMYFKEKSESNIEDTILDYWEPKADEIVKPSLLGQEFLIDLRNNLSMFIPVKKNKAYYK